MRVHERDAVDAPSAQPSPELAFDALPITVVKPSRGWISLNIGELWRYRELLYFLVWRDIKVRYKQTVVGTLWVVLQPFLTMLIFSLIFGRIARLPSGGLPYPVLVFSGLVPWLLFASGMSESGSSLVGSASLITKVYFPRLALPLAAVCVGLVDFFIALGVLIGLMGFYGITPSVQALAIPAFVLLAIAAALGIGLWLSMLNVHYRDVQYVIPFLTQIWMFATPVAYSTIALPPRYRWVISLNPMTSVVEGFRWSLLGQSPPTGWSMAISVGMVAILLMTGLIYFRRMEKTFADVI